MNIPPQPCDDYCNSPSDRAIMAEDRWAFEDRFKEAPASPPAEEDDE